MPGPEGDDGEMATTVKNVELALEREGLRGHFDAIEQNGGEVVMWRGIGHVVTSVRNAVTLARKIDCEFKEDYE